MKRYSSGILFSEDMSNVLIIHKLTPAHLMNLANFPGGKVDASDYCVSAVSAKACAPLTDADVSEAHLRCCARELQEETGLDVNVDQLQFVCTLKFSRGGEDAECRFYAAAINLDSAVAKTQEKIFQIPTVNVLTGDAIRCSEVEIKPMGNLAWLCAMAQQVIKRCHESVYTVTALDKHV